jgi:hypothetical protein
MPGRLDQQPSGVAVAGVGDPALAGSAAAGLLAGHQARPGPTVAPVKRCRSPVATASRSWSALRPHPASPAGPPPAPRPAWDANSPMAPPGGRGAPGPPHRPQHGDPQARLVHRSPDAGQPPGVRLVQAAADQTSPGAAAASTAAAGPQQSGTGVLAGSDQRPAPPPRPGSAPAPREPPKVGQPGQPLGVAPVGLDPTPGRAFQLGRRDHHPAHPGRLECPGQPEPGRASLPGDPDRAGQRPHPTHNRLGGRRQPPRPQLSGSGVQHPARIDRAATSRPTDRPSPTIGRPPVIAARPPQRRQPTPPSERGAGPQTG